MLKKLSKRLTLYGRVPRRVMAVALSLVMCLGMLPASAFAEGTSEAKWGTSADSLTNSGTLADAVAAANATSGTTYIQLQENVILTAALEFNTNKTVLDLNGKTIDRGLTTKEANGNVVAVYGDLTINDSSSPSIGKITGGKNTNSGGGVYVGSGGSFTLNGGSITGNTSDNDGIGGGGVTVYAGSFTMNGGSITDNTKTNRNGAGGVEVNDGSFTMTDGSITGNTSSSSVGGVYVRNNNSTFTMSGGSITDNAGAFSGGVYASYTGTFTMSGTASITDNIATGVSAAYCSGGVFIGMQGTFNMEGGSITGNTSDTADNSCDNDCGGGVYFGGISFNISGGANISGNKRASNTVSNVYLDNKKPITVTGVLRGTIGVSTETAPKEGEPIKVAGGKTDVPTYDITSGDAAKFVSDNAIYRTSLSGGDVMLTVPPRVTASNEAVYANGNALVIEAGTTPDFTNVFQDLNGNQTKDANEKWIKLNNIEPTAAGYDLSGYFIHGGGNMNAITGDTKLTMTGGKVEFISGGGYSGDVTGSTSVTMTGGTVTNAVYGGGGYSGSVTGSTSVTMTGGTVTNSVCGGGRDSRSTVKSTSVNITGGTVNYVFGGGEGGEVTGDTAVIIADSGTVNQGVYGGGGGYTATVGGNANVTITGGTVNGNVYGGGSSQSIVTGSAGITITDGTVNGNVYGNGEGKSAKTGSVSITITGGTVIGVIKGSDESTISVTSTVTIGGGAKVGNGVDSGVVINGGNVSGTPVTNGVASFAIAPDLTGNAMVCVRLPKGYDATGMPTIATGAAEGDVAKIKLVSDTAKDRAAYLDGTDIKIKEAVSVTGVTLNKRTTTLAVDGTETLRATVTPENAANQAVTWSSSATSVATVDSTGKVTAVTAGTAIITVTTADGNKTDTCTVTVTKAAITPTVTLTGWTYGGTANDPAVTGNTDGGAVTYAYKLSTEGDGTYTATVPTNAGSYTVKATIAETDKYQGGSATATFTIAKADQSAPAAPAATTGNISSEQITLKLISGAEYSKDNATWQSGPTFEGLTRNTDYTFYARLKGDANHNVSPSSTGATIKTLNAYIVTFDSQGATTAADPATKTVTFPITMVDMLPTPPVKTGYDFGGWFTQVNGGGTAFTAETVVSGDLTVYAKWTATPTVKTPTPVFESGYNLGMGTDNFYLTNDYASETNTKSTTYKLYTAATGDTMSGITVKPGDYGGFEVGFVSVSTDCYVTATAPGFLESDRALLRLLAPYKPTDGATVEGGQVKIKTPAQLQHFLNYCTPAAATLDGNTVTLTKDAMICYDINLEADFSGVFNLGGKTLTHDSGTSGQMLATSESVTLTLKNGTMKALNHPALSQHGGTVTLEDMTMDGATAAVRIISGSFTMTGSTLQVLDHGQYTEDSEGKANTAALMLYPLATVSIVSGVLKNAFTEGYTYYSQPSESTPAKTLASCIASGSTSVPTDSTATENNYQICKDTITVTKTGPSVFVPVTGITAVPTAATMKIDLLLTGTVAPATATNKTIVWSVKDAGTTGASITGNTLKTTGSGTVTVLATITNGKTESTNYTQEFTITITVAHDGILSAPLSQDEVDSAFGTGNATFVSPDTITINKDLVLEDSIQIDTSVTIDLDGKNVTVKDSTGDADGKPAFIVTGDAALTVTGPGSITGGKGSGTGNGGDGISGTGNGSVVIGGGASVIGGSGGGTNGSGGDGVKTDNGNITVDKGSVTGGSGSGNGTGGNGASSTGSGDIIINAGGSAIGGAGGTSDGTNAGGTGGAGTSTGTGGTTADGAITGGNGGDGGATSGNGGTGGAGANENDTINGGGTITGGNGGNIPDGGTGTPGSGGAAISGGGSAANPGPKTEPGGKGVKASAKVTTVGDTPTVSVPEQQLIDAAVSDAERADNTITGIQVTLTVEKKDDKPNAGVVENEKPAGSTVGLYLDIKLEKTVTKTSGSPVTSPVNNAEKPMAITLTIPEDMWGGSGYALICVHGGNAENLGGIYNASNHTLTAQSDKFSTYAIAYTPKAVPPPGGGGGGSLPSNKPEIPKSDGGSVTINTENPSIGDKVIITPKPDEGKVLDKITVTDKNGKEIAVTKNPDGTFSFIQPEGGVTIAVTFKSATRLPWNPFVDVKAGDWFHDSVKYVYENGLMSGTDSSRFSPNLDTSRGMIVAILWRLEGNPVPKAVSTFADVEIGTYYADAVAWAAENGIVSGYDTVKFGPKDPITREQLASILYRYARFKGMDTTAKGDLSKFTDQPSAWAAESVRWAVGAGIISGKGGGSLDPKGSATRAETAVMLKRYLSE